MNAAERLRAAQPRTFVPDRPSRRFESRFEPIPVLAWGPGAAAPLSFWQEQVWLHVQNAPDVPAYNESFTIRREGDLNVSALEKAVSEILRRHEAWRTNFTAE